ncbi:twin-arginine translocase subunit TatC [Tessaracoccus caeni]|uniref:twin-arginine translocase subunit TatC n=1 Tax=Tessaracoccus caeni TaxID=3031239 RepID=UPI0023DA4829|nr:twin-arginine translocase subunit TatC [Tessaracoccus caeni]MDF1488008.1 twin-arginine translocase subunit TatC [Tessaracoccus caeni]
MAAATAEPKAKRRRLAWLRPPQGDPEGRMSLYDHLRELRYRITISVIAITIAALSCVFFYSELVAFMMWPFESAKAAVLAVRPDAHLQMTNIGVLAPFTLGVIACVVTGIVASSPVWLYQIWAFVAPGLVKKERKYALGFLGAAIPLFLSGCVLAYVVWPKGIEVLLKFTPPEMDVMNLLEMSEFLGMQIKIVLVFGLSFVLPVVLVGLNLAGIVRGFQLGRARRFVIFGSVVFAAIATPSTDPFTMLALAVPISVLFLIAELVCRILDKRKGITEEAASEFSIDLDDGK